MKYQRIEKARFIKRINRFVAEVLINEKIENVHVKNTGRLKELLLPNMDVVLELSDNPKRKMRYSLIAVLKHNNWINIDSQAPNKVAFESIQGGIIKEIGKVELLKSEVRFGDSRFDLYYEKEDEKGFIEVKGVTFERDGIVSFPDAPTSRGTKHVLELIQAVKSGYKGIILFVIQMEKGNLFTPNKEMDKIFTSAINKASQEGVQILAYNASVSEDKIELLNAIPVKLS